MRSKCLVFSSLVLLLCIFSSCDLMRTLAGRPTSDELASMREVLTRAQMEDKARADSLFKLEQERIAAQAASDAVEALKAEASAFLTPDKVGGAASPLTVRYHIVVGSFKEAANAGRLADRFSQAAYETVILSMNNGSKVVAVSPSDDPVKVLDSFRKAKNESFCPKDAWILVNE